MSLGGHFPPSFRQAQLKRQLKAGVVIKLYRRTSDGTIREKRYVVVHVDGHTLTCIINSGIGAFLANRPALLRCQVKMAAHDHTFMNHDSHIDCSQLHRFATDSIINELLQKPEWMLGNITHELCNAMIGAIKYAETLSVTEVTAVCESLTQSTKEDER
jgi:hypothetical protein